MQRVFAHLDDAGRCAADGLGFRWSSDAEISKLVRDGALASEDADAIRAWLHQPYLRGVGESAERAKRVAAKS